MPNNFERVTQNIYRGGAPNLHDLQILVSVYKIKRVVSLDAAVAAQIAPYLKQNKVEQIIIPLNPAATTITDPLNNLMRNIVTLLTAKQPVYIHCLQGQDRTGLAIALFRVLHDGWTCEQALGEARKFGYGKGISVPVQQLYKQVLCGLKGKTDISSADDAVISMRTEFDQGRQPMAFNPQQSFAPEVSLQYLQSAPGNSSNDFSQRRQERLQNLQKMYHHLPLIGEYANNGPISGAGPVENSGILQLI